MRLLVLVAVVLVAGCDPANRPIVSVCDDVVSYHVWRPDPLAPLPLCLELHVGRVKNAVRECRRSWNDRVINVRQDIYSLSEAKQLVDRYKKMYLGQHSNP